MTINVNNAAVQMFDPMVKKAYQAMGFKLKGTVRTRNNVIGESIKFPKMTAGLAQQKALQDDVVPLNLDYSQVELILQNWHASDYSDIFGQKEINFDEMRELSESLGMSIGRRADQQIIDALENSSTSNTIANGAVGFTYEKFLTLNKFMSSNNVRRPGLVMHVAIDATAEEDLLAEEEFIDNDFTRRQVLDNGSSLDGMEMFGYKWHVFGDMAEGGIPVAATVHSAFAWAENSVGLGIGMDFSTEVNYIPVKTSFLVTSKYRANAKAIDPVGIVQIDYV